MISAASTRSADAPALRSLAGALGAGSGEGFPPNVVADVIFTATTDSTDQLRNEATPDAIQLLARRRAVDDAAFFTGMRNRFGIGAT